MQNNYWRSELLPMAVQNACVRHALFTYMTAYALDYNKTEDMVERANHHYSTAVRLLKQELDNPDTYTPGKDNAVVAALIMLLNDDVGGRTLFHSQAPLMYFSQPPYH